MKQDVFPKITDYLVCPLGVGYYYLTNILKYPKDPKYFAPGRKQNEIKTPQNLRSDTTQV